MKRFRSAALAVLALPSGVSAQDRPAQDVPVQDVVVTAAPARPYDAPRLSDPALARLRGGINLPNGLQVAIGIDIQTRVDDVLVLHTIYASDGPAAGVRVYTDGSDAPRTAPGTVVVRDPGDAGAPTVVVTRSPAGTSVFPGTAAAPSSVNLVSGDPGTWLNANGQTPVAVEPNGPAVAAGPGTFRLTTGDRGSVVTLDGSMLQVQHLIGQATGIAVANTADGRAIETVSSVNIDLQGGTELATLAGLFMADRIASDVAGAR